jgi:hypothetical protein
MSLMGLIALQSLISAEVASVLGYLLPPWPACFHTTYAVFLPTPAPVPLRDRVHPLMSFISPSEPVAAFHLPDALTPNASSGFFPLRDINTWSPHSDKLPHLPSFRPQRFSRSQRLPPPCALRAYFIPQPRPGFALQGFSPLPSHLASSARHTLLPIRQILLPASCPTGARSSRFASRVFLRAAIRCCR